LEQQFVLGASAEAPDAPFSRTTPAVVVADSPRHSVREKSELPDPELLAWRTDEMNG
jgi:hypothetical protein